MIFDKLMGVFLLLCTILLTACGGSDSNNDAPTVKTGYVYMGGGYVEGLTYQTETQSGTTGSKGDFKYLPGETVNFKVGNQSLPPYKIKLNAPVPLTHFDVLNTRNPNSTYVQNLTVLLQMLDADANVSNGIKIDPANLVVANRVNTALAAEGYLSALSTEAAKENILLKPVGTALALATAEMKVDGVNIAPFAFGSGSFNEFNSVITLSADGSADANSDNLTYSWTIDSRPKSSKAVITNPPASPSTSPAGSLSQATLLVDAFDEPYIFRLTVTDPGGLSSSTQVIANVTRNPVTGVYTRVVDSNTRQLVAITDTGEIWGYGLSASGNLSRKFAGTLTRVAQNPPQYDTTQLSYQATQTCKAPCNDAGHIALTANLVPAPAPSIISVSSDWASSFLLDTPAPVSLTEATLSDAPLLLSNLMGTYREKDSAPDSKDWKITSKGEFNFYKNLPNTNGSFTSTLCAIGKISADNNGQVLNNQGLVTRYTVPVTIEFKNDCDENFDVGITSNGYFVPDPALGYGAAGFSFIGKNPAGNRWFLRHFVKVGGP